MDLAHFFRDDELWATFAEDVAPDFDPDCEFVIRGVPRGEMTYVGLGGFRALWLDWMFPWVTYRGEVQETIDLGARVVAVYTSFGRVAERAPEVEGSIACVWAVHQGRVAHAQLYSTRTEAVKTVGLEG